MATNSLATAAPTSMSDTAKNTVVGALSFGLVVFAWV